MISPSVFLRLRFRYTLRAVLGAMFVVAMCLAFSIDRESITDDPWGRDPPDDAWRTSFGANVKPLSNTPQIVAIAELRDPAKQHWGYRVTVRNIGDTALRYRGSGGNRVSPRTEVRMMDRWMRKDPLIICDVIPIPRWCYLYPQSLATFYIVDEYPDVRERTFGAFNEIGTDRAGLVLLAVEPPPPLPAPKSK